METPSLPEVRPLTRRRFIVTGTTWIAGGAAGIASADDEKKPTLRIGMVTDLHFADKKPAGSRHYRESTVKLKEAVDLFKEEKPDFIIELGDIVDAAPTVELETGYLRTINAVFKSSGLPIHYVLGNHCLATLTKAQFFKETDKKAGHYSFDEAGVHCVVLDACFNSKMENYAPGNFSWSDPNIPKEQQEWLKKDLAATRNKVLVFVHQRLDQDRPNPYAVHQSAEVRKILQDSGKVIAVFQGHSHQNDLRKKEGVSYCTLAAMVEGAGAKNNAYGILEVYSSGAAKLKGYRKLEDRAFG